MKKILSTLTFALLFAYLSTGVSADAKDSGQNPLSASMTAYLIDSKTQEKQVLKADDNSVSPNEVLEYEVTYTNTSDTALRGVMATLPIPASMSYHIDTVMPKAAEASIDGSTFSAIPLTRIVKNEDGTSEKRDVPVEEYRALRWNLGVIEAGKSAVVTARMSIDGPGNKTAGK